MEKAAVMDIGSNSVRLMLLINGKEEQFLETTRLGEGVAQRRLQKIPVERTVSAVTHFYEMARARGMDAVYAFATSAVRDAVNAQELLGPIAAKTGLTVDVLPGDVEAQLAYMGAAQGRRACVADIGGASTELVAGEGRADRTVSLQMGAVRLKERFGQERLAAQSWIDDQLESVRPGFALYADAPWLGIGGTITTLAAMEQEMEIYCPEKIQGYALRRERVCAWVDRLWELPCAQRTFAGLRPQRADIIAHGALILERLMTVFNREVLYASTGDNLMGYLRWKAEKRL